MNKNNNKNSFKTPEGYFEGFTDKLLDKMSNLESHQEDSVLPKNDGFTIPDGYFEGLNKKIQEKLTDTPPKVIPLRSYRKYYYLAAASVAAILLLTIGLQFNQGQNLTFEELAESEIENYFEFNELGLTTYEIAEVIPVDELEISDILTNQFKDENIIDYLDDHVDDIEELNLTDYDY